MATYAERLHSAIARKRTPALVGLDPRETSLPSEIRAAADRHGLDANARRAWAYEHFCCRVIDVVAPLVPAVKPQVAFFEDCGPAGFQALAAVIRHARNAGLFVIADAKRGDIGSTAEAYASAWLAGEDPEAAPFAADALTVNPYLGPDTLQPFVQTAAARGAGLYVLVRTSNPESGVFQELLCEGRQVYQHIAAEVERLTESSGRDGRYGSVGAVVGATYPEELAQLRALLPRSPLLVPGYGAQGGSGSDVAAAFDAEGLGALVNSSRGILFAEQRDEYRELGAANGWEAAVEAATRDFIEDLRRHTPAGRLG
ncbi:MAG: orotidine-5'-phosphate decarboxylase [Planctomyces sp.]|nr:orotidine-5'-phosphate decarboxylase [Planctomyces sp.]